MRVLLDTNALLRWDNDRLRGSARRDIERADEVFVSAVSLWEVAIKRFTGKLKFSGEFESLLSRYGFAELPLTARHVDAFLELPAHHTDSFDRMLIAQALDEGLTIVTSDRAFELYRVPVIWA